MLNTEEPNITAPAPAPESELDKLPESEQNADQDLEQDENLETIPEEISEPELPDLNLKLSINGFYLGVTEEEVLKALLHVSPRINHRLLLSLQANGGIPPYSVSWNPEQRNFMPSMQYIANSGEYSEYEVTPPQDGLLEIVISLQDSTNQELKYILGLPILPELAKASLSNEPLSRRQTRRKTFEILFELELNPNQEVKSLICERIQIPENKEDLQNDIDDGVVEGDLSKNNFEFMVNLIENSIKHRKFLDLVLRRYPLQWEFSRVGIIEKILMRMALVEMMVLKTPFKVVVNEVVQLAKVYCKRESGKFINGILGNVFNDLEAIQREFANESK